MFDSILRIGELISDSSDSLPIIKISENELNRANNEPKIGFVVFDNINRSVRIEPRNWGNDYEEKYAYIGNVKGNKPQDRITTNRLEYILGNVDKPHKFALGVLAKKLSGTQAGELISSVLKWYDPKKYSDKIENEPYIDKASYVLYTVRIIDDKNEIHDIATMEDYKYSLLNMGETIEGKCHFCGADRILKEPNYPEGTILTIFNKDKKGFLPNLSSETYLAHAVCPGCRRKLELGNNYIKQNMVARVEDINMYLIPNLQKDDGRRILKQLKADKSGWILEELKNVHDAELEAKKRKIVITIVIGRPENSKFKVWRVIPEVSEYRLIELTHKYNEARGKIFDKNMTPFEAIYASVPVSVRKASVDIKDFIELFEHALLGYPVDENYVYSTFMRLIMCIRYGSENAKCANKIAIGLGLENLIMIQETLIYWMKLLNIMGEQGNYDISNSLTFPENIGIKGGLKGLFLLGELTAYVGFEQQKKREDKREDKVAILNKLDFEGMDYYDIITFTNRLFESLRDYGQLNDTTNKMFSEACQLIESDRESLSNPQKNVFHILFGYSLKRKNLLKEKDKNDKKSSD